MLTLQRQILLRCECLLRWNDAETSLILCKKHYNDYDTTGSNQKTEQFIKKVIDPSGSQFSAEIVANLK
jgi:hypothetical protein